MKKILLITLIFLGLSCENKQPPLSQNDSNYTEPVRPIEVPLVNCSGDTIEWNWRLQVAYNEGRVFFERDTVTNCVHAVILKLK
jgi:hypothetical protein